MMGAAGTIAKKLELLLHPELTRSLTATFTTTELKLAHAHLVTSGLAANLFALSRLLAFCALSSSPDHLRYAKAIFSGIQHPTLFMYNSMIRGYSQSPQPIISIHYYLRMLNARISPDRFTFPFLIRSCSSLGIHHCCLGRSLHCQVLRLGLNTDVFFVNNSITMYSGWGDMASARQLFDENSGLADVVSWTAMITGCANHGDVELARWFFERMPSRNSVSWNAMIAGYARAGMSAEAWDVFHQMPERNAESWSSLVSGFAQSGHCKEALTAFDEMVRDDGTTPPNEATLVSAVSACAQQRDLERGERVHGYIEEHGLMMNVILGTALVDMYGKCGSIDKALEMFKEMPAKNVYTWNSMIAGMALNGSGKQALTLFWKMRLTGTEPNDITFIGVLSACSHSGLVDDGERFFELMTRGYGIRPLREHYGCMVDLLGRAGLVSKAVEFVDSMPVEPHPGLLGALAGACKIHGNVELGEEVGKRLIELEPEHGGRYVLLANIYAGARRWDDMVMVRKLLKERRAAKVAGNSAVEVQQTQQHP